jgi:hypothetical protein
MSFRRARIGNAVAADDYALAVSALRPDSVESTGNSSTCDTGQQPTVSCNPTLDFLVRVKLRTRRNRRFEVDNFGALRRYQPRLDRVMSLVDTVTAQYDDCILRSVRFAVAK